MYVLDQFNCLNVGHLSVIDCGATRIGLRE